MKILMLSDFHIGNENFDMHKSFHFIDRAYDAISGKIDYGETIVVLICGDIIDKGNSALFSEAEKIFDHIRNKFSTLNIKIRFVPGNHDICNNGFKEFDTFTHKYNDLEFNYSSKSVYQELIEDVNFIYASSVRNGNYNYGQLDYDQISACIDENHCNYFVFHHSPFSEDNQGEKDAVIRESIKLFDGSFCNAPYYILHGHYHGDSIIPLYGDGLIIEAGSIFYSRENVNNQFNLLYLQGGQVELVYRFTFEANHDSFKEETVYPQKNNKRITNVKKIQYKDVPNYINRKVALFSLVQERSIKLYFDDNLKSTLFELCMKEKHIVLLGEAGCGKSIELLHLAFLLSQPDCMYYPVYIKLNTYTNENIDDFISEQYSHLNRQNLFFIFDGFDEIEYLNLNKFSRKLNAFTNSHPNTHFLISCRTNFYKFEDKESEYSTGTFTGFKEYGLCPLSSSDINKYITTQNLSQTQLWDSVNSNNLNELLQNPFYLVEILRLYKANFKLPNKLDLMSTLVKNKFYWDKEKYKNTKDIEDAELELLNLLQKIAFSLQCLQKVSITNTEFQQLTTSTERELLKYSGVWLKDELGEWYFEHNNFREYLTAEYLVNMPIETIKNLITYHDDRTKIKESWQNVLSFLALSYQNSELLDWIQKTDPSSVVKFETSRINEKIRAQIFCNIYNEYKDKNKWISWNLNSGKDLANFGQTAETLEFLLAEIKKPVHFRAQSNAIYLLQNFSNLFGKDEIVKEVLLSCCKNDTTRSYEKKGAIIALSQLGLSSTDITNELYSLFGESAEDEIRYGLYTYFLNTELQDEFVEYFIKGLKLELKEKNSDCLFILRKGIKSLKKSKSIKLFIEFCSVNDITHLYHSKEIFADACKKMEKFYEQNPNDTFNTAFNCMILLAKRFERDYIKILKQFFENTSTVTQVIYKIIDSNIATHIQEFILTQFEAQDYMGIILVRYKVNSVRYKELFKFLVSEMNENSNEFKECQRLIFENEGIKISGRTYLDYEKLQQNGRQKYFDCLFSKDKFECLLKEFICLTGNNNITYEELQNQVFEFTHQRYDLQELIWGIIKCEFNDQHVKSFLEYVDWESFVINEIYRILDKTADISIYINSEQKKFIYQYCNETIKKINLNTVVHYNDNGGYSCSWDVIYITFFSEYFNFDYDETVLLDMLTLPSYFFKEEKTDQYNFPKYIINKISEKSINDRVKHNIDNLILVDDVLCTHIKYCMKKHLPYAIKLATEICLTSGKEWEKRTAFEYLLNIIGEDFIYQIILPNADDIMIEIIANALYNNKNIELENKLIQKNKLSFEHTKYLGILIKMNSMYGLQTYYDLASKQKSIPDYSEHNNICHITEAIGEIYEPKLLPLLQKLVELRFEAKFKDKDSFGLYNSLCKALRNVALNDYMKVKVLLQSLFKQCLQDSELRCFCSYLLDDIESQYYNNHDIPWTIKDVKSFLDNNSMQN